MLGWCDTDRNREPREVICCQLSVIEVMQSEVFVRSGTTRRSQMYVVANATDSLTPHLHIQWTEAGESS